LDPTDLISRRQVGFEVNLHSGPTHGFTHPQNPSEVRADAQYKVAMMSATP
jgi:hypothetical protein